MNILAIACDDLAPVMRVLSYLIGIFKIGIPIILIALVILDFSKAVITSDDKKMKDASSAAIKRIMYALIIFLVPTIISLLFKTFDSSFDNTELTNGTEWISCFNKYL